MALSMNLPIRSEDIESVRVLKEGVVFMLTGVNQEKLVVKHDFGIAQRFRTANSMMRTIDPRARLKVLSTQEEGEILAWARSRIAFLQGLTQANPNVQQDPDMVAARNLEASATAGTAADHNPWVKMEALGELKSLDEALAARSNGDKSMLKKFRDTLKAPGGLERLGRIIAADLVIGNVDRFDPYMLRGGFQVGNLAFRLEVTANVGNVFMTLDEAEQGELRGVDFTGGWMVHSDLTSPINENQHEWGGRVLMDTDDRHEFAAKVIRDLEKLLSPHRKNLARSVLGHDAKSRLNIGMKEGTRMLRERLERKYPGMRPVGLQQRLQILGSVGY